MGIREYLTAVGQMASKYTDQIRTLNIQRLDYQQLLHDRAVELGVKIRFGCKVNIINQSTPSITLSNDEILTADLIIGADGTSSPKLYIPRVDLTIPRRPIKSPHSSPRNNNRTPCFRYSIYL